jgi:hypothetical protein
VSKHFASEFKGLLLAEVVTLEHQYHLSSILRERVLVLHFLGEVGLILRPGKKNLEHAKFVGNCAQCFPNGLIFPELFD